MKTAAPYLDAILRSISKIEASVGDNKHRFMDDLDVQDANLMRLLDIGERLATVRDSFQHDYETHYHNDFPKIIGLRNIIAHEYGSLDLARVWETIEDYLPAFKKIVEDWLKEL